MLEILLIYGMIKNDASVTALAIEMNKQCLKIIEEYE